LCRRHADAFPWRKGGPVQRRGTQLAGIVVGGMLSASGKNTWVAESLGIDCNLTGPVHRVRFTPVPLLFRLFHAP